MRLIFCLLLALLAHGVLLRYALLPHPVEPAQSSEPLWIAFSPGENTLKRKVSFTRSAGTYRASGDAPGHVSQSLGGIVYLEKLMSWGNQAPHYPRRALEEGWEGKVKLKVVFGSDGQVLEVAVIESSGRASVDEESEATAHGWVLPKDQIPQGTKRLAVIVPLEFWLDSPTARD